MIDNFNEAYDVVNTINITLLENNNKIKKEENAAKYIHDKFLVNGKEHANAPTPNFDESKFNESEIPHSMRFKEWGVDVDDDTLQIDWETYGEFNRNDVEDFLKELNRYINYLLNEIGNPPLTIDLSIHSMYADADSYTENGENFYFDLIKYNQ